MRSSPEIEYLHAGTGACQGSEPEGKLARPEGSSLGGNGAGGILLGN